MKYYADVIKMGDKVFFWHTHGCLRIYTDERHLPDKTKENFIPIAFKQISLIEIFNESSRLKLEKISFENLITRESKTYNSNQFCIFKLLLEQ